MSESAVCEEWERKGGKGLTRGVFGIPGRLLVYEGDEGAGFGFCGLEANVGEVVNYPLREAYELLGAVKEIVGNEDHLIGASRQLTGRKG